MYDEKKADRVVKFVSSLTHTKGIWARKPFNIIPWEEKLLRDVYGTVDESGNRQYRIVYVEIPKKNGKTELGSAIALYMLCADGEQAPEVYSAAADISQASLIYQPAATMVENNFELSQRLKVLDSRKRIVYHRKNGAYQVLSSDVKTKHGISPSCILFDEIHAQPNDELWRVLTSGTDYARQQQLIFVFTTAGIFDVNAIWWRLHKKAQQIIDGIIKDDSFYPLLYCADIEKDEADDEKLWERVNPSLGHIFTMEKIRKDYAKVKNDPVELQDFKRFRLNIPIKQTRRWLDMAKWDKCKKDINIADYKGRRAYCAMDLSSTQDLTAIGIVFPEENPEVPWSVFTRAYCPEETILDKSKQDQVHYDIWAEQGFITPTPGDFVDYNYLKKDLLSWAEDYDVKESGYDPYAATQLAGSLDNEHGLTMVEMRQGALTLSAPIKSIFKAVLAGLIAHDGNPVLRWCIDNCVMVQDANENLRPAKDKSTGRIDCFVALIMAWGRAMVNAVGEAGSVYEKRGLLDFDF